MTRTLFPSDWKLFLGLSRTPHGALDLAAPALGALLWLGRFPDISIIVVGIVTAFAGYTAVYALNDLVDYPVDKKRLSLKGESTERFHVDEVMARHPIAQGLLSYRRGLLWFAVWAAIALAGAWWLNPFCAFLFVLCAALEALYCMLLRVTHWKIVPQTIVKATGGLAGLYAVDPDPAFGFAALLFLWLAAWEVGGQNIANDIVDMEDDRRVGARTTATVLGLDTAVLILISAVSMAAFGGVAVYWVASGGVGAIYPIAAVILGYVLLLKPAAAVYRNPGPDPAAELFNKASYVPVAFLTLTVLAILTPI